VLKHLQALKNIRHLELPKTLVTEDAVKQLRASAPQVAVRAEGSGPGVGVSPEQSRSFWWLLLTAGALAGRGLVVGLFIKGKKAVLPVAIASVLVMLGLVGYRLYPILFPPPAPEEQAAKERRLQGHTGPVRIVRFLCHDQ